MNDKDTVYKELRIETGGAEDAVLGMVESLAGVQEALDQIVEKMGAFVVLMTPQTDNVFNNLMDGVDGFNKLADGRSNVEDIFEAINEGLEKCEGEDFSIFKALIPETEELTTTLCEKTKELAGVFDTSAAAGVGSVDATVTAAMNAVIGLPDRGVAEDLEGKAFGSRLAAVAFPRIPLLAKGAVLPANRPFLAMVGDQRQGTDVEAPLATIQEAVALVMGDQVAAMMAGFREVVREQQALRAAVEGIEVGDEVIGRAAVRYGERMAVVKGS